VSEWNETLFSGSFRGFRGGSWNSFSILLLASGWANDDPSVEFANVGFRVASIPEPSSLLLAAMASLGLLLRKRRNANPLLRKITTSHGNLVPGARDFPDPQHRHQPLRRSLSRL
jgi:hypothetical protein